MMLVTNKSGRAGATGLAKGAAAFALMISATAILGPAGAGAQAYRPPERAAPEQAESRREAGLEGARIGIGRIRYGGGGDWYGDPSSLPNLLREFERRTGIRTSEADRAVDLSGGAISAYPFLYMTGHGNVRLTPAELSALRGHLLQGGFLFADDNYGMDGSFRRMIAELFPERTLAEVPLDHPIYHCFYDLDGPPKIHEHDGRPPEGLGVFDGDRLMVFYTHESDIGDGLEDPDVHRDPPEKRELAARMAVNVLFYALTN